MLDIQTISSTLLRFEHIKNSLYKNIACYLFRTFRQIQVKLILFFAIRLSAFSLHMLNFEKDDIVSVLTHDQNDQKIY